MTLRRALFVDRDGLLVEECGLIVDPGALRLLPGVPGALCAARAAGFAVVVVTNQAVVARGLLDEAGLDAVHHALRRLLAERGAELDAIYYCPHHPNADVPRFRVACECRKPRPGMLLAAARDLGLDLTRSAMVGDRVSDIVAGSRAGTRTVLVETGAHAAPPIESPDGPVEVAADFIARDLDEAVAWVIAEVE
jgi:D-glycero-D-manno-heptose 1,7-bisphosphate phosphatase